MKVSELKQLIKEEINNVLREEQSLKRFLDPYHWFVNKDIFQRRYKNVDLSIINDLVIFTKKQGDNIETVGKNVFAISNESNKLDQSVWQYMDGILYYVNPNIKSIYDTYIPSLINSSTTKFVP
jgi:hypothetical protein